MLTVVHDAWKEHLCTSGKAILVLRLEVLLALKTWAQRSTSKLELCRASALQNPKSSCGTAPRCFRESRQPPYTRRMAISECKKDPSTPTTSSQGSICLSTLHPATATARHNCGLSPHQSAGPMYFPTPLPQGQNGFPCAQRALCPSCVHEAWTQDQCDEGLWQRKH